MFKKSLVLQCDSYCSKSMLKSPMRKMLYFFLSISENVASKYCTKLVASVLGCRYMQPQREFLPLLFFISIQTASKQSSSLQRSSLIK